MYAAHELRPMQLIRAFDRWLRVLSTTTERGPGKASTELRCVEFGTGGKTNEVCITVPPHWEFEVGDLQTIAAGES